MYTYVSACMYVECICVRVYVRVSSCVWLCVIATRTCSCDPNYVRGDSELCRYGSDTLAIRRPIHGMICRSVPGHAVKTRRLFGSKIVSFHVSIFSYIFTIVGMRLQVTLIISCDFLLYFTSLITCIPSWVYGEECWKCIANFSWINEKLQPLKSQLQERRHSSSDLLFV